MYLTTSNRGSLSSQSALPRVSRQVREEFVAVMFRYAPAIVVSVKDFDFGHVITFLNRLSNYELRGLVDAQPSRRLIVELSFSHRVYDYGPDRLTRWINRLHHPSKRGSGIDGSYLIVRSNVSFRDLQNVLDRSFHGALRDDLAVQKIVAAIRAEQVLSLAACAQR